MMGRGARSHGGAAIGLAIACLTSACQLPEPATNRPLSHDAAGQPVYSPGYAVLPMIKEPKGQVLFSAAFSGGGKRSAAFAHGVLRGLRNIQLVEDGQPRRLLDELDLVSAVSGGSFPAMHYGLYRDRSFETFPAEF